MTSNTVIPRVTCHTCLYSDPCIDCNGRPTGRGGCLNFAAISFLQPATNLKLDRPRRCVWYAQLRTQQTEADVEIQYQVKQRIELVKRVGELESQLVTVMQERDIAIKEYAYRINSVK